LQVSQGDWRGRISRIAGHSIDDTLREIVQLHVRELTETE